jgi:hypothetical protein
MRGCVADAMTTRGDLQEMRMIFGFSYSLFMVTCFLGVLVSFDFFPRKKIPSLCVAVFFWKSCFFIGEEKLKERRMGKSKTKTEKESNGDD